MDNQADVIVTPWTIEEAPLDHWFRHKDFEYGPRKVTGITSNMQCVYLDGDMVSLVGLANGYVHSEHPVGPKANWQRCGHVEQRGVVWVGRDDLYFRDQTAVINGVRYAIDGAEPMTVYANTCDKADIYPFLVVNTNRTATVTANGKMCCEDTSDHALDVVPAIRMEAK